MKVAIVGAGLVGRLLAWHLCALNIEIHLFSKGDICGKQSCSHIAAGMISPLTESPLLTSNWYPIAKTALSWWPKIIASLPSKVFYRNEGTLVVTHPLHRSLLMHFIESVKLNTSQAFGILNTKQLLDLEPSLQSLIGCYLPDEACIHPKKLLPVLGKYLLNQGVTWRINCQIYQIINKIIECDHGIFKFDQIFDCRGLGAKENSPELRGVRGELIECEAPEVNIKHTLRLLHPRYPCYVVPRESNRYAIGATQIESEDEGPVTIQSALSLLTAAVSLHTGFHEAKILKLQSACRPTFLSQSPIISKNKGVISINGMFRHGFLLAPELTAQAAIKFLQRDRDESFH